MEPDDQQADIGFACPRCGTAAMDRYYGPCRSCRSGLAATAGGPARDVEVERYEPAMHVVPNQVATKD